MTAITSYEKPRFAQFLQARRHARFVFDQVDEEYDGLLVGGAKAATAINADKSLNEKAMLQILAGAWAGDFASDRAIKVLSRYLVRNDLPVHIQIEDYRFACDFEGHTAKRRKPKLKLDRSIRDEAIAYAAHSIHEIWPTFHPTRNDASRTISACDIVAAQWKMKYSTVKEIWLKSNLFPV